MDAGRLDVEESCRADESSITGSSLENN
jgi:hypothetical protein